MRDPSNGLTELCSGTLRSPPLLNVACVSDPSPIGCYSFAFPDRGREHSVTSGGLRPRDRFP